MPTRRPFLLALLLVLVATPVLMGARRNARIGCGGSLPRSLVVVNAAGDDTGNLIDDGSRTTTFSAFDLEPDFTPFEQIRWRGDPSSYVDVFFDTPIVDLSTSPPTLWTEFAPFVRYEYPDTQFSNFELEATPTETAASLPLPVQFGVPTALRFYDRGACSGEARWRSLAEGFVAAMDAAIAGGIAASPNDVGCDAHPVGNWSITPRLTEELEHDSFRIGRQYGIQVCNAGDILPVIVTVSGYFTAPDGHALAFRLRDVHAEGVIASDIEAGLRDGFEPAVNAAIPSVLAQRVDLPCTGSGACMPTPALACRVGLSGDGACLRFLPGLLSSFVPGLSSSALTAANVLCIPAPTAMGGACAVVPNVHRVHERPEGIEVILSEWDPIEQELGLGTADPLYPLLARGGACERETLPVDPLGGYLGPVFEIPPPGPLPFGDTP